MAEGVITGSNARVVAMLLAFQDVIRDFTCPPAKARRGPSPLPARQQAARSRACVASQVFSRELEGCLKQQIQYLVDCRPQSMPMGNAIKVPTRRPAAACPRPHPPGRPPPPARRQQAPSR